MAQPAKDALKALRAVPAISRPATTSVRFIAERLGVTPEFAIKHLPRSGLTVTRLPNGSRARFWSRGDDWIANQVFWRGWDGHEGETAQLFWRLARNAAVVIDVGAHVGYYTVLAALANRRATVVALEPLPAVFERLKRNLELNRLENVVALQEAAAAADGRANFYHVSGGIPSSSSLSAEFMRFAERVASVEVGLVRLDTLVSRYRLDRVDLVKLDTETTEPDVLVGMQTTLRQCRPNIICEVLTRADVQTLWSLLEPYGYSIYHLTDRGAERREKVVPHARWLNYFFTVHDIPH